MDQGTAAPRSLPQISSSRLDASFVYMGKFADFHSRVALKKYVKANYKISAADAMFDSLFNRALKAGVDKGVFAQPKGTCRTSKPHVRPLLTRPQEALEEPSSPRRSPSLLLSLPPRSQRLRKNLPLRRPPQRQLLPSPRLPQSPRPLLSPRLLLSQRPRPRQRLHQSQRRRLHQKL
jgi:histone H1/5